MLAFIICLSLAFMIFIVTTTVVCIRRKQMKKRHPGQVIGAPIVVTSATHTAPGGYPVSQMPGGASTTTTYQTHMYAAPYPPQQGTPAQMHMPMPMPMPGNQPPAPGMQPYVAPYPPMPAAANMNPPSYDMAVGGAGSGVPNNGTYEKQSAYNPNYSMQ